ncbi:MAG: NAD-dependent protein deacetylase [Dokdonella sp.]|nr:NAD-dependent protein deacetylase [Dokdonella sp.]MCB1574886.1 NAD-dependent protein deacetylase [Xanthomonadales bacterium]MCB1576765.1 NAD-dependent protein deacetylase [Xanthomonadales bacterium]
MQTEALREFIEAHPRLFVLTGAGCSTDSGFPDYRDAEGQWKRTPPVTLQAFLGDAAIRRRYWARNMLGWDRFGRAAPNAVHHALVQLERQGRLQVLLTQNVDRLHQRAGSRNVIDLHGRMDRVRCMTCGEVGEREALQARLLARNPDWAGRDSRPAPDGDADFEAADFSGFEVPHCARCNGLLKPDVVFFGENVPRERVEAAIAHLEQADAILVVGSSLMVYSGFRFVRLAAQRGKPIAAVNLGRTRADDLLALKVSLPCAGALAFLLPGTTAGTVESLPSRPALAG